MFNEAPDVSKFTRTETIYNDLRIKFQDSHKGVLLAKFLFPTMLILFKWSVEKKAVFTLLSYEIWKNNKQLYTFLREKDKTE